MKKLISMTDFVLEQEKEWNKSLLKESSALFRFNTCNYAKFLKQPLELWMFVPCDKDGNVLKEPLHIELYEGDTYDLDCKKYQQAKERCLFEGYPYNLQIMEIFISSKNYTIEIFDDMNLKLTLTAIKQIGL